jgi:DNA replication and repair protein RecF
MGTLSRLQGWNFRNLRHLDLPLERGITLLVGRNGQGKTNLLEAVCYLGLLRSFRTQRVADLRHWDAESFSLRGELTESGGSASVSVSQGARRYLQVDGQAVDRASDFINRFLCVPLVPEDVELVRGAAALRRRFLDIAVTQFQATYLHDLQQYCHALASRNLILRTPQRHGATVLAAYEALLVRHGARVEVARRLYVRDLDAQLGEASLRLLGADGVSLAASYASAGLPRDPGDTSEAGFAEALQRALDRNRERDARDGNTSVGPHRGDMAVTLGGRPLACFGSEGECRLASLALRLSALALARRSSGQAKAVVALVDDVTGELDGARRRAFFQALVAADQVLVTATAQPEELAGRVGAAYTVQEGVLARL